MAGTAGYKITDVALLSLAERCPGLHKLDLSGCDAISDVGISWLSGFAMFFSLIGYWQAMLVLPNNICTPRSSGCHALLNLNLNGCRLLTDTGWLCRLKFALGSDRC